MKTQISMVLYYWEIWNHLVCQVMENQQQQQSIVQRCMQDKSRRISRHKVMFHQICSLFLLMVWTKFVFTKCDHGKKKTFWVMATILVRAGPLCNNPVNDCKYNIATVDVRSIALPIRYGIHTECQRNLLFESTDHSPFHLHFDSMIQFFSKVLDTIWNTFARIFCNHHNFCCFVLFIGRKCERKHSMFVSNWASSYSKYCIAWYGRVSMKKTR